MGRHVNTRKDAWSDLEEEILKVDFPIGGAELCQTKLPQRSLIAIKAHASVMGLVKAREFSMAKEPGEQSAAALAVDPALAMRLRLQEIENKIHALESERARILRDHNLRVTKAAPDIRPRRVA